MSETGYKAQRTQTRAAFCRVFNKDLENEYHRSFSVIAALLASSAPVAAHHSFAAEYDATKPISVTGVVKKVEWQNPHIWFYVDEGCEWQSHDVGILRRPTGMLATRHHQGCLESRRCC
jgi:hypothetical protein